MVNSNQKLFLSFIFLVVTILSVFFQIGFAFGDTPITDCQTFSGSNVIYTLQNDVYAAGTCFLIDSSNGLIGSNLTLDCQGNKVYYGENLSGAGFKSVVAAPRHNVSIINCNFVQRNSSVNTTYGIELASIGGIIITNNNFTIDGNLSSGIYFHDSDRIPIAAYNFNVTDIEITSTSDGGHGILIDEGTANGTISNINMDITDYGGGSALGMSGTYTNISDVGILGTGNLYGIEFFDLYGELKGAYNRIENCDIILSLYGSGSGVLFYSGAIGNVLKNCNIYVTNHSDNYVIKYWGGAGALYGNHFISSILSQVSGETNQTWIAYNGGGNNYYTNVTWSPAADNIYWFYSSNQNQNFWHGYLADIYVNDTEGNPVSGATVTIQFSNGSTWASGVTDGYGYLRDQEVPYKQINHTASPWKENRYNYSNFNFSATKTLQGMDYEIKNMTQNWVEADKIVLTLDSIGPSNITLLAPTDNYYRNNDSGFSFLCNLTGDSLTNATLWGNWSGSWAANKTDTLSGNQDIATFIFAANEISEGPYKWTCYGCDSTGCRFASVNYTLNNDYTPPSIWLWRPDQGSTQPNGNITFQLKCYDGYSGPNTLELYGNWSGGVPGDPKATNSTPLNNVWWDVNQTINDNGVYEWYGLCYDEAGNYKQTPDKWFIVDNTTTKVYDCINITSAGNYILQNDINNSAYLTCINISANNVTFDGNGHWIDSNGAGENGIFIYNKNNTVIKDCLLNEWDNSILVSYNLWNVGGSIFGNVIKNTDYSGIKIVQNSDLNNSGLLIYENNITNSGLVGIDLGGIRGSSIYSNSIYNSTYGIYLSSPPNTINNTITNNNITESGQYDIYIDANINNCNNTITSNYGSGGRLIGFVNAPAIVSDYNYSELILCNASNTGVDNVNVWGSDTLQNNGILVYYSNDTTWSFVNSSGNSDAFSAFSNYLSNINIDHSYFEGNLEGIDIRARNSSIINTRVINSSGVGSHNFFLTCINCTFNNISSDGSTYGVIIMDFFGTYPKNVLLINSSITNSGSDGIYIDSSDNVTIDGCNITTSGTGKGINNFGGSGISNLNISNSYLEDNIISIGSGISYNISIDKVIGDNSSIYLGGVTNAIIKNSLLNNTGYFLDPSVYISYGNKTNITNVSIENSNYEGINMEYSYNTLLRDSSIKNSTNWEIEYHGGDIYYTYNTTLGINYPTKLNATVNTVVAGTTKFYIKSVETPPSNPLGLKDISKYLNLTTSSSVIWSIINVSYNSTDIGPYNESSLQLYKYNSTGWYSAGNFSSSHGVDTVNNVVWANITSFNGVFAPLIVDQITSCGELNGADTIYELDVDVSSTGTCFEIKADNVTLDCNNHKITYATSTEGYGIYDGEGHEDITIENCLINSTRSNSNAVMFINSQGVIMSNNTYNTNGTLAYDFISSLLTDGIILRDHFLNPNNISDYEDINATYDTTGVSALALDYRDAPAADPAGYNNTGHYLYILGYRNFDFYWFYDDSLFYSGCLPEMAVPNCGWTSDKTTCEGCGLCDYVFGACGGVIDCHIFDGQQANCDELNPVCQWTPGPDTCDLNLGCNGANETLCEYIQNNGWGCTMTGTCSNLPGQCSSLGTENECETDCGGSFGCGPWQEGDNESNLELLRYTGGAWQEVPFTLDEVNNLIFSDMYYSTHGFGTFAIMENVGGASTVNAPENVSIYLREDNTTTKINWSVVTGAEGYILYWGDNLTEILQIVPGGYIYEQAILVGENNNTYNDTTANESVRRFYRIAAYKGANKNISVVAETVGKYTVTIDSGQDMFSLPLNETGTIERFIPTTDEFASVYTYIEGDGWKYNYYFMGAWVKEFDNLNISTGYWTVDFLSDTNVTNIKNVPLGEVNRSINLGEGTLGWESITTGENIEAVIPSTNEFASVYTYDPSSGWIYDYYFAGSWVKEFDTFEPTIGYWTLDFNPGLYINYTANPY